MGVIKCYKPTNTTGGTPASTFFRPLFGWLQMRNRWPIAGDFHHFHRVFLRWGVTSSTGSKPHVFPGPCSFQLGMINGIETRLSETVVSAVKDKKKGSTCYSLAWRFQWILGQFLGLVCFQSCSRRSNKNLGREEFTMHHLTCSHTSMPCLDIEILAASKYLWCSIFKWNDMHWDDQPQSVRICH